MRARDHVAPAPGLRVFLIAMIVAGIAGLVWMVQNHAHAVSKSVVRSPSESHRSLKRGSIASRARPPTSTSPSKRNVPAGYRLYKARARVRQLGRIRRGDRVDVMCTMSLGEPQETINEVIVRRAYVQEIEPGEDDGIVDATLLVHDNEVPKLYLAGKYGDIRLVKSDLAGLPGSAAQTPSTPRRSARLSNGMGDGKSQAMLAKSIGRNCETLGTVAAVAATAYLQMGVDSLLVCHAVGNPILAPPGRTATDKLLSTVDRAIELGWDHWGTRMTLTMRNSLLVELTQRVVRMNQKALNEGRRKLGPEEQKEALAILNKLNEF